MDNIEIPKPFSWPEIPRAIGFLPFGLRGISLLLLLLVCMRFIRGGAGQPQLIKGVPILGLDEKSASLTELRQRFRYGSKAILLEGYSKYKDHMFYVPTLLGERLIVPPRYVEELKNAPTNHVDSLATLVEMFEGQVTTIGKETTILPRVIKNDLNQSLATIVPDVNDEIQDSLAKLTPPCNDWTEVNIADILMKLVAHASSQMFGGAELSQNEEWTKTMIDFTGDSFKAAQRLKDYPHFIRPLIKYVLPEVKDLFRHFGLADRLIGPMLSERSQVGGSEKKKDLIQWILNNKKYQGDISLAHVNLHAAFAAIHTSAVAVTHIVYDLCAMPEYIAPLREEIDRVLGEEGGPSKKAFARMTKLDSFMRESQRFNPLLLTTYERLIHRDYRLSDGVIIPAGTQIGVCAHAIGFDPDIYHEADQFRGFRFDDMRKSTTAAVSGQNTYVAANLTNMSWGFGAHACPGRWFAEAEIKLILINLLQGYDLKFPTGKGRPGSQQFETQNLPDTSATVMLKKRVA